MGWNTKEVKETIQEDDPKSKSTGKHKRGRRVECIERETKNVYRRAFSETQLLDVIGTDTLKIGHSYHCISGGGC